MPVESDGRTDTVGAGQDGTGDMPTLRAPCSARHGSNLHAKPATRLVHGPVTQMPPLPTARTAAAASRATGRALLHHGAPGPVSSARLSSTVRDVFEQTDGRRWCSAVRRAIVSAARDSTPLIALRTHSFVRSS